MLNLEHDFPLDLAVLPSLSPIQLLLVQFNPRSTQVLADAAYSRFLVLRRELRRMDRMRVLDSGARPLAHLRAFSFTTTQGDGSTTQGIEELELHVLSDCISVRQVTSAEHMIEELGRCQAESILDFCCSSSSSNQGGKANVWLE